MEKMEILAILSDWNFWAKDMDTGIQRDGLLHSLTSAAKAKEIVVVKGVRRSGKSTLLLQFCKNLINSGVRKEDILIINFEDPRFSAIDLGLLNRIYETYLTELNPRHEHYVVLDEVQVVSGWEKFARFLHENKKVSVFVTGSSSKLLSSEYSTVLAGRHLDIEVGVLSFAEYLTFLGIRAATAQEIAAKRHEIKRALKNYIKWGGFPKVTLVNDETEKKELLNTYFRDIVIKDISMRHRIKELEKLESLAKYYLANTATLQSFNKIKNFMKLSLDTVERFSQYMSDVYILSFVRKFSYSEKEQLLNQRKIYCNDTGLRNSVAFVFSKDMGRLAENIVFNELKNQKFEIFYWKNGQEVDFITKKGKKISDAIQVCWNMSDPKTKEREIMPLVEACTQLRIKRATIITEETEKEENIGGIKVKYVPLWLWLTNSGL